MKKIILLLMLTLSFSFLFAQTSNDTIVKKTIDSVLVNAYIKSLTTYHLPEVSGVLIFAGKKTNVVNTDPGNTNLTQNIVRTIFAKVPGLNTWDMDGAGSQLNIATRGTDAHRSIEMNMRQNGYGTNSDMFGYPENHYTVPLQGVKQVQYVRGSAALQFGPQFGGMMNYIMKQGDSTKPVEIESQQTVGSNNLFNSFTSVGGTKGKFSYYAFFDYRHTNGWRANAGFNYHALYANLTWKFSSKANISLQFSRSDYVQQIAGGLTDLQFNTNAKQSVRSRNYFQPFINIPALIFNYNISANTHLEITSHVIIGQRNSVQFINTPNILDTINKALNSYNPRLVDRDYYNGFTTEARLLHHYKIGALSSTLAGGLRYFNQVTKRKQKGVGTTGSDFDLTLVKPYGNDLRLKTHNYAAFIENIFQVTPLFSVTPGVRYEIIRSDLSGVISNASVPILYKGTRNFPLFGLGLQYQVTKDAQIYGNASQAYRPYLYANATPADRIDKVDENLKDSKGYDIDLGVRGHYKSILSYDLNGYYLFYGDRVGLITQKNADSSSYLYSTNIGNSISKGLELFIEISLLRLLNNPYNQNDIKIFNSVAYNSSKYTSGTINRSGVNTNISGNYVENAPEWINRSGVELQFRNFNARVQYSFTGKNYNDAFNTVSGSNGVTGLIPAYHVWDASFSCQFAKQYELSGGVNNFTDEHYFNRRITFYPGPGILPADGRTFYISLGVKL